ncbi:MAG: RIP metalloprotease RseP [Acidobacteria bacterium]|nr:RIP metalloprotease RseP [Acidobacteriota bacterium]
MISSFLTDAVVVVVVLGGMVFLHELGHFLAAKGFGVRVLTFSLGFGKRLFGFKRGDTDYRVSILPLGGYVRMAGDDPTAVLTGDPGEFLSRPRWQRFVIILMGPAMNFVLAIVVLAGVYRFHYQKPAYEDEPVKIGAVEPHSAAAAAGLQPGDVVVKFDGVNDPKWQNIKFNVLTGAGHAISLTVLRDGKLIHTTLTPEAEGPNRTGRAGWLPYMPGIIEEVNPGQPASKAGLKPGDMIVGFDGKRIYYWPLIVQELRDSHGQEVQLTILRDGKLFQVQVKPEYTEVMGLKTWRIGVTIRNNEFVVRELPLALAIEHALRDNYRNFLETFDVLGKIVTRQMSARSLAGPIGIAQISGEAYRRGISDLLMIVSFISLQLGILNLLPIPILDGGQIFLLAIEGFMRHDLSLEIKERFAQVGIVFLLLIFVFVVYNDIVKTIRPS